MKDEQYVDDYATCAATYATFRLYHLELDPTVVTARLRIQPSHVQRRGDIRSKNAPPARVGGWFLSSENAIDSRDVRRHLDWILDQLLPVSDELAALRAAGYDADVSCYWVSASGHGGPSINPSQSEKLVHLGLEVSFDVYFTDGALKSV